MVIKNLRHINMGVNSLVCSISFDGNKLQLYDNTGDKNDNFGYTL
jgi:protein required for attachment to host cells